MYTTLLHYARSLPPAAIAAVTGLLVFMVLQGFLRYTPGARRERMARLKDMVREYSGEGAGLKQASIVRRRRLSDIPALDAVLSRVSWSARLELLIERAGVEVTVGAVVLICIALFFVGTVASGLFLRPLLLRPVFGALLGALPVYWLLLKKRGRMRKFERQLPDALDLVTRALLAGHAFSSSLRMIADECEQPIAGEFRKVVDEVNLGLGLDRALENLCERVDCQDLRFFAVSVNIQRETGGNLAEILGIIARLIRDRFKLYRDVRTLSAEGRMSAIVLTLLPFAIGGWLLFTNPGYLNSLLDSPMGWNFIYAAGGFMLAGILVMRRMVDIKV